MDNGYILIHRNMLTWEWYTDTNTKALFLHLLLKANWQDAEWRGEKIKRGQLIAGRETLAESTGISPQTIRTCLERLKSTNEITITSTNKYSVITIVKYDDYQVQDKKSTKKLTKELTNNQPSTNQQSTTVKEEKESKEEKELIFKEVLESFDEKQTTLFYSMAESVKLDTSKYSPNRTYLINFLSRNPINEITEMFNYRDKSKTYTKVEQLIADLKAIAVDSILPRNTPQEIAYANYIDNLKRERKK